MTHANRFEIAYLRLASTAAVSLSKDPVTKVGSVISTPDFRQFSLGYNGFATGIAETPERWEKPNKYNFVIHAEINAVVNSPFDTKGCILFCTHVPCYRCLLFLINARIYRIIYLKDHTAVETTDKALWEEAAAKFPGGVVRIHDSMAENILAGGLLA